MKLGDKGKEKKRSGDKCETNGKHVGDKWETSKNTMANKWPTMGETRVPRFPEPCAYLGGGEEVAHHSDVSGD